MQYVLVVEVDDVEFADAGETDVSIEHVASLINGALGWMGSQQNPDDESLNAITVRPLSEVMSA